MLFDNLVGCVLDNICLKLFLRNNTLCDRFGSWSGVVDVSEVWFCLAFILLFTYWAWLKGQTMHRIEYANIEMSDSRENFQAFTNEILLKADIETRQIYNSNFPTL